MRGSDRKTVLLRIVLGSLVVLWCALIFAMSNETAIESSGRSTGLVRRFIGTFVSLFGGDPEDASLIDLLEYYVRKAAHMFIFFVLSTLVFSFLSTCSMRLRSRSVCTLAFCLLYCLSDEIHQLFVDGRSGNLFDVCVDMGGVTVGLACSIVVVFIIRRIKKQKNAKVSSVI